MDAQSHSFADVSWVGLNFRAFPKKLASNDWRREHITAVSSTSTKQTSRACAQPVVSEWFQRLRIMGLCSLWLCEVRVSSLEAPKQHCFHFQRTEISQSRTCTAVQSHVCFKALDLSVMCSRWRELLIAKRMSAIDVTSGPRDAQRVFHYGESEERETERTSVESRMVTMAYRNTAI